MIRTTQRPLSKSAPKNQPPFDRQKPAAFTPKTQSVRIALFCKMMKLILQHIAALAAAVIFGAMFAVAISEVILPPARQSFFPRSVAIAIYAAWIAGGLYLIFSGILIAMRRRKHRTLIFQVTTAALITTWTSVILLSFILCIINPLTHWLH